MATICSKSVGQAKKNPQLVVSMQPGFNDLYARALVAGRPHMIDSRDYLSTIPEWNADVLQILICQIGSTETSISFSAKRSAY